VKVVRGKKSGRPRQSWVCQKRGGGKRNAECKANRKLEWSQGTGFRELAGKKEVPVQKTGKGGDYDKENNSPVARKESKKEPRKRAEQLEEGKNLPWPQNYGKNGILGQLITVRDQEPMEVAAPKNKVQLISRHRNT